jgi:hypothetical protein
MVILRIEHTVLDFESWKKNGFDSDPIGRKASGVVRYRVLQPIDDSKYALIDLEFESVNEAEVMLEKLKTMWANIGDGFGWKESPRTRIIKVVEEVEL